MLGVEANANLAGNGRFSGTDAARDADADEIRVLGWCSHKCFPYSALTHLRRKRKFYANPFRGYYSKSTIAKCTNQIEALLKSA